jgi:hypothetical protein
MTGGIKMRYPKLNQLCMLAAASTLILVAYNNTADVTQAAAQQPSMGFELNIEIDPADLTLHEPIVLGLGLTNDTKDALQIDLGRGRIENLLFSITSPDGTVQQLPQLRRSGFNRVGTLTINPGQSYHQQIVLNEWFSFNDVGKYNIALRLAKPASADGRTIANSGSASVRLEVQPRNEAILSGRCQELARAVETSISYEDAANSALALSYVNDPAAVPSLKRVLRSNKLVEPIAIEGLERIANKEAVNTLLPVANMNENNTAALARAALLRIQAKTSDKAVKELILRELKETENPRN